MSCCREPDPAGGGVADELRKRVSAGALRVLVIVPDTKAAQHDPVAAGGVLPQPGVWWWATYYARPGTDEDATAQARERLSVMLDGLGALGVPVGRAGCARRGRSGQFRPAGGH
jgi:hypothetical protein